jgi:hypothetical protein
MAGVAFPIPPFLFVCNAILASSPDHSHVLNVARRKGGRPGTRPHVSDVTPGTNLEST